MTTANLISPDNDHIMGTDAYGRDIWSRIVYGIRVSLSVSVLSVLTAALIGVILGLVGGYLGGTVDSLISWITNVLFSFPSILLAIVVVAIAGTGTISVILAIGIAFTPIFARIARAPVLSLKEREFVLAARSIGSPDLRILFRHIFPNSLPPIIVQFSLSLSGAAVIEASLSFLGLGVQPPTPSLGSLVSDSRTYMEIAPWTVIFPGVFLGALILGANLFGDAVQDALDPQLRSQ
jgi:peptide/nickel transport system permease protein